jgi:hypothetical protein
MTLNKSVVNANVDASGFVDYPGCKKSGADIHPHFRLSGPEQLHPQF